MRSIYKVDKQALSREIRTSCHIGRCYNPLFLVVLDIFVSLMPGPEKSPKFNRAAVFDSWHLQLHNSNTGAVTNRDNVTLRNCTHLNGRVVPVNGRHYVHNNGAKSPNEKVETCPLCGDLVKSGWGRCVHCGEVLERNARIPATHNEKSRNYQWKNSPPSCS